MDGTGELPKGDPGRIDPAVVDSSLELWRRAGKRSLIPITGSSMEPLIRPGDRVVVSHACDRLRAGDLIVFRQSGELIAHRLIQVRRGPGGPVLLTRGDNAPRPDPPVYPQEVAGRVVAIEQAGRLIRLDTPLRRAAGRWTAGLELARIQMAGGCLAAAVQRLVQHPNPIISRPARWARGCFSWQKKALRRILYAFLST